jgi:hypothetical protein
VIVPLERNPGRALGSELAPVQPPPHQAPVPAVEYRNDPICSDIDALGVKKLEGTSAGTPGGGAQVTIPAVEAEGLESVVEDEERPVFRSSNILNVPEDLIDSSLADTHLEPGHILLKRRDLCSEWMHRGPATKTG